MSHRLGEVCVHGSLARSCEPCELTAELDAARTAHRAAVRALSQALGQRDRLADGIREHKRGVLKLWTSQWRRYRDTDPDADLWSLLALATDDREPWRNNDCPHGYGFDDCCHDPDVCDREEPDESHA